MKMLFIIFLYCFLQPGFELANIVLQTNNIPVEGYKLFWSDEFNGNALDRTKWKFRGLGKRGDAFNVMSSVKLDGDGHLIIQASRRNDSILAGIIDSEKIFETKYGYFECRASMTRTKGIWPAFWLQSSQNVENGNTETNGAEIDIFEYFIHEKKDSVAHNIHWGGYGSTHRRAGPVWGALQQTVDGFHVFGLEWTSKSYSTFVDGVKTYSGNTLISKVPEFIVLSLEVDKQVAGPLNTQDLPDSFVVDYVRVYKKE